MTDEEFSNDVLFAAAKRNNISLYNEYVAERGAKFDPNVKDALGNTPLHYSSGSNHEEVTKLLLGKGANANVQNNTSGETPLHRAIWGGHFNMVKLLIEKGADATIANNNNQKPVTLAKSKEMKAYLESAVLARDIDNNDIADDDEEEEEEQQGNNIPSKPTRPPGFDEDMIVDDDED